MAPPPATTPVDRFHRIYYDSEVWKETRWLGVPAQKCPLDLWIYQEILGELRPDLIIETGTAAGGSALFLASVCDLLGQGVIVTIDVTAPQNPPLHDRITYLNGSSTGESTLASVRERAQGAPRVLVILDSAHEKDHVLTELRAYGELVTPGSYLIVEDTNINGHPALPDFGPGPNEAVEEFLAESDDFEIDRDREKFLMTFNPRGYLRKLGRPDGL